MKYLNTLKRENGRWYAGQLHANFRTIEEALWYLFAESKTLEVKHL